MANIFKHAFPIFFKKKLNNSSPKRYYGTTDLDVLFNDGSSNLQQMMYVEGEMNDFYDSISDIDNTFTALRTSGKKDLNIISVLNSYIDEFSTNNLSNAQFNHFKSIYSKILKELN
jgi:hypothetical protein